MIAGGLTAQAAQAGTPICTLSTASVSFGHYDPTSTTAVMSMGSGSLLCTYSGTGFSATITMSTGSSGSYASRKMVLGGASLNYNVYIDPGYSLVFGNGSAGTHDFTVCYPGGAVVCTGNTVHSGVSYTGTVYGLLPAGQNVKAGVYTDNLIVTVTY
jgi:spore coat protein U-like protein